MLSCKQIERILCGPLSQSRPWLSTDKIPTRKYRTRYATYAWLSNRMVKGHTGARAGKPLGRVWDKHLLAIARYRGGDGTVKIAQDLYGDKNKKGELGRMLRELGLIVSGREAHSPRNGTPAERVWRNIRRRLYGAGSPLASADCERVVGCPIDKLVSRIEAQFQEGMTWENYGLHGWHLDHRLPCASFDLTNEQQAAKCFHFSNLQPLWALDNMKKGCRVA